MPAASGALALQARGGSTWAALERSLPPGGAASRIGRRLLQQESFAGNEHRRQFVVRPLRMSEVHQLAPVFVFEAFVRGVISVNQESEAGDCQNGEDADDEQHKGEGNGG